MLRATLCTFICWLVLSSSALAQLQGQFYIDKEKFIVGEPVYLHFKITNTGTTTLQILTAYRYSFCAGYLIKVSDGSPAPVHPSDGCSERTPGGSCASSDGPLGPGETKTEDILLNYHHSLGKPGTYQITASRDLPYGTTEPVLTFGGPRFRTTTQLKIMIESGDETRLKGILKPYVADLTSEDQSRNSEAHLVLGSVAPLFLENMILGMLNSESSREFAVTTLGKMNTQRSRKALADVASRDGEWQETAIRSLGEMGDVTYFPTLLRAASNSKPGSNVRQTAIRGAAQLGHDKVMPFLLSLLQSNDYWDRINAVQGMYESGSRQAVPSLIVLLRDNDDFIARMAADVLVTLTHRTPVTSGPYEKDPVAQYQVWQRWWSAHGTTALIFGPRDCGEVEPFEQAQSSRDITEIVSKQVCEIAVQNKKQK